MTVVEDGLESTVLYLAPGTPFLAPGDGDGNPTRDLYNWQLVPRTWMGHGRLSILRPGVAHSVNAMWNGRDREFLCWYVNLQAPFRRTKIGFDSMDHVLDLVIEPDLRRCRWKDEDEFADAVASGYFSVTDARAIRAEAERALAAAHAGHAPYTSGWEHWKPDPAWPIPALPEWWDETA